MLDRAGERNEVPAGERGDFPGVSPFSDPGAQLRRHVDQGRLRVDGRTTVRGRAAYRLASAPLSDSERGVERETVTYLVDARTYVPLAVRARTVFDFTDVDPALGGRQVLDARVEYLRYEPLEPTETNVRKLRMGRHPGATR